MKTLLQLLIFAVVMLLANSAFAAGDIDTLIQHASPRGGGGMYALRMGYVSMALFGAFWVSFVLFNIFGREFVGRALSETKDGVCAPSAFRLLGYITTTAILYAFTYNCVRRQTLDTTQLGYLIIYACALLGLVKIVEVFSFFRGTPAPKDETPKP